MSDDVGARVEEVRARIAVAAARAGRSPAEVKLVAVTKGVPPERIAEAIDAGVLDFGENRVQELVSKAEALPGARWHMIGTLQRNKVRHVVGRVVLLHSVDSLALLEAIAARARSLGLTQDVLLEVNTSGERTKHGLAPDEVRAAGIEAVRVPGVRLRGLMTIGPEGDVGAARACFRLLRELGDRISDAAPGADGLSMGMSGDFEAAVEEGATIVRVGSAIFGPRPGPTLLPT